MTWTDLTVAGAFIAGTIAGGLAVIQLTRIIYARCPDR